MNRINLQPMPKSDQAILDRAAEVFQADERVRGMWLHGAVARGEQDAGSDLDIVIAVRDKDVDSFAERISIIAARQALVKIGRYGKPSSC